MSLFPFDSTGMLPMNLIKNEIHSITTVNGTEHNYLIPTNAPFHSHTVVVVRQSTGEILTEGTDYEFTHLFQEGLNQIGTDVHSSITFLDMAETGNFVLQYQTIGGDFVNNVTQALEDGIALLSNLQSYLWEDIADVPDTFPPTPHREPITDIDAVNEIILAMDRIVEVIQGGIWNARIQDIADLDTQFIAPMMQHLTEIATSITMARHENVYHEAAAVGGTLVQVGAQFPGEWFDLPLRCGVATGQQGRFMVQYDVGHVLEGSDPTAEVYYRFTVNGGTIERSYNKNLPIALPDNAIIQLQARVDDSSINSFTIASDKLGSSLSLIRVGR